MHSMTFVQEWVIFTESSWDCIACRTIQKATHEDLFGIVFIETIFMHIVRSRFCDLKLYCRYTCDMSTIVSYSYRQLNGQTAVWVRHLSQNTQRLMVLYFFCFVFFSLKCDSLENEKKWVDFLKNVVVLYWRWIWFISHDLCIHLVTKSMSQ